MDSIDLATKVTPSKKNQIKDRVANEVELANTNSKMVEQYTTQYDANHDFAIFGTAQGGIQTLAEKTNMADLLEGNLTERENSSTANASGSNPSAPSVGGSSGELVENREIHEL